MNLESKKLELMERIEAQKRDAAREAREAETAKREAEAKVDHENCKMGERQRKEDREATEQHYQLLCDMKRQN